MSDILARYGPFFLYSYTLIMGVGVVAALGVTAGLARRVGRAGWFDGVLAGGAGALVAGRVLFVWLNAEYFGENPFEAWQMWLGGLNYHGALLGGLAGVWLWARLARRPLGDYAGLLAPGLALLAAFGWAACRFEGCAYGLPAPAGVWAADLPDDLGVFALRYRTQLFGAIGSAGVFVLALWAFGRARPGVLFWGVLGGLSLVRAAVALGRGDPAPEPAGLRFDLMVDLAIAAISLAMVVKEWLRRETSEVGGQESAGDL